MSLYRNKYRVESARLKEYDYSSDGYYFVTICTKDREYFFGDIIDGQMVLSEIGTIAQQYWCAMANYFSNIQLDECIIMPNHVHGIIVIDNRRDAINRVSTENRVFTCGDNKIYNTCGDNKIYNGGGITGKNNPMFYENLSRFIRWYKGRVSFECRKNNPEFAWQSRFYDRIIRDNDELMRTRKYIINNAVQWAEDELFKPRCRDAINRVSTP